MDIFAHGLWAGIGSKIANDSSALNSRNIKLKTFWTMFWGVFPDLFAFTIPFVWLFWNLATGGIKVGDWPHPDATEPTSHDRWPVFNLASELYNYSHSLAVFALIVILVIIVRRTIKSKNIIPWAMSGWLLHILIDVPSHSYKFYPTPVFYPLSNWKFDGMSWADARFMIVNYSALLLVGIWLYAKNKRKRLS